MQIDSLHELESLVARARALTATVRRFTEQPPAIALPPLPVPLKLTSVEIWAVAAEEAVARPRIAESKKLLADVSIDVASIPLAVLGEPGQLKDTLTPLATIPVALRDRSRTIVARSLAQGISAAELTVQSLIAFVGSLSPLLDMEASYPAAVAAVMNGAPDTTDGFAAFAKRAQTIREHLTQIKRLGIVVSPTTASTIAELEAGLARFAQAYRELNDVLAKEGLTGQDKVSLNGLDLNAAAAACGARQAAILQNKEALRHRYITLQRRLAAMGVTIDQPPDTVSELQQTVAALDKALTKRHRELVGTLGEDAVLLVEAATTGELPSPDKLTDSRLGKAIRRATEAGFHLRIEAPDEVK